MASGQLGFQYTITLERDRVTVHHIDAVGWIVLDDDLLVHKGNGISTSTERQFRMLERFVRHLVSVDAKTLGNLRNDGRLKQVAPICRLACWSTSVLAKNGLGTEHQGVVWFGVRTHSEQGWQLAA